MSDGQSLNAYTVRLELDDEPGELLRALEPIANNGGNLLSIFHERGAMTPRGRIPVEVDLECAPERFEVIVDALSEAGVQVIQAGADRYGDTLSVVLIGPLISGDLSDTLDRIEDHTTMTVTDLSLSAPSGPNDTASARLRLATERNHREASLSALREIAAEKGLQVIEPLVAEGGGSP